MPQIAPEYQSCPPLGEPTFPGALVSDGIEVVLACYGSADWAFNAIVDCYQGNVDVAVGGATWLPSTFWCTADDELALDMLPDTTKTLSFGLAGNGPLSGVFEVRGHFADPQSANCGSVPFGTTGAVPIPDSDSAWLCRQIFVATKFVPATLADIAGRSIKFSLSVPCVGQAIDFAGAKWVADPESRRAWQPTDSYSEDGWIEVVSDSQIRYYGPNGSELLFNYLNRSATQACVLP